MGCFNPKTKQTTKRPPEIQADHTIATERPKPPTFQSVAPAINLSPLRNSSVMRLETSKVVNIVRGRLTDHYEVTENLGEGAFGCVRLALHKNLQTKRAVKSILKSFVKKIDAENMLVEVEILRRLDHPNILRIHEVIEDIRFYHIVTELCTGGELLDRILKKEEMTENTAASYLEEIMAAVEYCHIEGILHRDIKPENVLFKNERPDSPVVVIDFGVSRLKSSMKNQAVERYGIPLYTAPEVFEGIFSEKSDAWSCGVVLYLMLCGYLPFSGKNERDAMYHVQNDMLRFPNEEWATVSEEAKDLVEKLLEKDPEKRISLNEAFEHDWIEERASGRMIDRPICVSAFEKLGKFKANLTITHAVLEFIAAHFINEKELGELRELFIQLDENKDGKLSREELSRGILELDIPFANVEEIICKCDVDGDGFVDYSEFITAAVNWKSVLSKEKLEAAFKAFDADGDGFISLEELKGMLGRSGSISEDLWNNIMQEVDENNDGVIDMSEFEMAIRRKTTLMINF